MKQAYILRRDGRDYQAPDLETLQAWARDGRVLPADMVYSPRYQSWYRARDLRELRAYLPSPEAAQKASARQQFWLRKGDQNYATDSLDTILRWAGEGNIEPDDYIYHPSYGKWFRAGDSPQLASRFPAHMQRRNDGFSPLATPPNLSMERRTQDMGVEHADSTTKTRMDLRTEDLRRNLSPRVEDRRDTARSLQPVRAEDLERRSGQTNEMERLQTEPEPVAPVKTPEPVAPITPVERGPAASKTIASTPVASTPVASTPAPSVPAPIAETTAEPPAPPEPDEDAKFADTTGALRLFYDVARAFVVTRDLRPGEIMESDCALPSTKDDFKGKEKKAIYRTLADRMQTHLDQTVRPLEGGLSADNRPGFYLLINRAEILIEVIRDADAVVGTKPPERFVIGNRARPKMSPAEEEAMLRIDAALTGLISVRKR